MVWDFEFAGSAFCSNDLFSGKQQLTVARLTVTILPFSTTKARSSKPVIFADAHFTAANQKYGCYQQFGGMSWGGSSRLSSEQFCDVLWTTTTRKVEVEVTLVWRKRDHALKFP
jgi:hypothetical protein